MADESVFDAVNAEVKASVAQKSTGLRARVVGVLTDAEIDKRADLLLNGLRKVGELRNEAKKLAKPTAVVEKRVDGKFVKEETFTPDAVKKIKENDDKLAKLEAALGKAFQDTDYEPLKKALGSAGNAPAAEAKEEAAE